MVVDGRSFVPVVVQMFIGSRGVEKIGVADSVVYHDNFNVRERALHRCTGDVPIVVAAARRYYVSDVPFLFDRVDHPGCARTVDGHGNNS